MMAIVDLLVGSAERRRNVASTFRVFLLGAFAVWTVRLIRIPIGPAVTDSFIHMINLPFHEAGHVIFSPFGRLMTVLGGSLMQLFVPLGCSMALLFQTRDPFGAALTLWWFGENFLDLAPYIGDARALQLVLLGGYTGAEVEGHDWEFILGWFGSLDRDQVLARLAEQTGTAIMTAALIWAFIILMRELTGQGAVRAGD